MKFRFFLLMLLPICMVGCNDEMDSLVKGPSEVAESITQIAFAYNEDEEYGDYVLDYYGIRDWVESLPKRSTSMMILQNYTIIGL